MIAARHPVKIDGAWADVDELLRAPRGLTPAREDAIQLAFADPIKEACMMFYDFTPMQLWGPSEERNKPDERYPRKHVMDPLLRTCNRCKRPTSDGVCSYLTPREALQKIGTEMGRALYEDTWATIGLRRADEFLSSGRLRSWLRGSWFFDRTNLVVFSDCRFENEAWLLHQAGGQVWRVVRPGAGLKGEAAEHDSEAGLGDHLVDVEITNDGSLTDLRNKVEYCLRRM